MANHQTTHEYDATRREATTWVKTAGELAVAMLGRAAASRKADASVVTEADYAVQGALLDAIARRYPEDAVISEETQAHPDRHRPVSSARRCWVVDPIDGTRSYARGFPGFCVSVGMLDEGMPVVGLIYNPLTRQMYSAAAGAGAWRDEQRVSAQSSPGGGDVLIAVPSRTRGPLPAAVHRWIDQLVLRNLGSTAMHLALVASGALDAAFADECRLWDIAAGAAIVAEAGGRFVALDGREYFPMDVRAYGNGLTPFIAGSPQMVQRLLAEYLDTEHPQNPS